MTQKEKVTKKLQNKVDNLNKFVEEKIKECGGENDLYLDNSSTVISCPEIVLPNYNINDKGYLCKGDEILCTALLYDKEYKEWYIDDEVNDYIKWEKQCINRGVKYFKEYNPEWDNDENIQEDYYYNL